MELPNKDGVSGTVKRDLIRASQLLTIAVQSPGEIVDGYKCRPAEFALAKTAHDLGIFERLSQESTPVSTRRLANESGCNEILLGRVLRGLASVDAVYEPDVDLWEASKVTRALAADKGTSSLVLHYDLINDAVAAVPRFLKRTGYKDPVDQDDVPFKDAFSTEYNMFAWVHRPEQKDILSKYNVYMSAQRDGHTFWCDFFQFDSLLIDYEASDGPLLIDIGGASGHVLRSVKKLYPELPRESLLLQDLPETIATILQSEPNPFNSMAYNFFTPQPVKGARAYYMRNVLHDFPDHKCQTILTNIRNAMAKGYSKLLINELVVPNKGAGSFATHMDILMLSLVAGKERTYSQWESLLLSVGLQVEKIWQNDKDGEAVIVAVL